MLDVPLPPRIGTLQVVFKISERCNIDCGYCYYFNMGEASALGRPPRATAATAAAVGAWLRQGCEELGIARVLVSLHGGEPMMLRPAAVSAICRALRDAIGPGINLGFVIQTNGTILTDAWLDVLAEHRINVGVSVDGDRDAQDRFRLDKRGRSTFERVDANLRRLVEWSGGDPARLPSTISVMDWRNDYGAVYRYLRSLGVRQMSFLLPDRDRDAAFREGETARRYGDALSALLDAWLEEDDPTVGVRQVGQLLHHFRAGVPSRPEPGVQPYQVIVMGSDGTAAVDDSFIPALGWYREAPSRPIAGTTLAEFLSQPIFAEVARARQTLPSGCQGCTWAGLCGGGDLENRFSASSGFDNPSAYCDGLDAFHAHACGRLIAAGYPLGRLQERLEATLA